MAVSRSNDWLHDEVCNLLMAMGAVPGSSIVDKGMDADAVLVDYQVVVEVKTLTRDRARTKAHHDYGVKVISNYRRSIGLDPHNFDVRSEDLPLSVGLKIAKDFARPFKGHITKANRQIKNTKSYLEDAFGGVLIVALPNNFYANEASVVTSLSRMLPQFSAVDTVLTLTIPSENTDKQTVVVRSNRKVGKVSDQFFEDFDKLWLGWLDKVFGGAPRFRFMRPEGAFETDYGLVSEGPRKP